MNIWKAINLRLRRRRHPPVSLRCWRQLYGRVLLFQQWHRSSTSPTNVVISMYVMLLIDGRFSLVGNMKKRVGNILQSWTRITIQQSNSYASAPPHVNMDHSKPTQKTSAHFFLLNLHGMSMWWSIYLACPIAVRCMLHDVVGVGGVSGDLHHH